MNEPEPRRGTPDRSGTHRETISTYLQVSTDGLVEGYAFDPTALEDRLVVEIIADGLPVAIARAHTYWDREPGIELGDGCYAFAVRLAAAVVEQVEVFEARLANTGTLLGRVHHTEVVRSLAHRSGESGRVSWTGGLRLTGWLAGATARDRVKALFQGCFVAEGRCDSWSAVERVGRIDAEPAFHIDLPIELADGRVRSIEVVGPDGKALPGSPLQVIAFQDGLVELLDQAPGLESERARANFAEGLLPQSMPFSAIESWLKRYRAAAPVLADQARICVVLIGETALERSLASLDGQIGCSWAASALTGSSSVTTFASDQLAAFLDDLETDCGTIVFAVAGTVFRPDALLLLDNALRDSPDANAAYGDVIATCNSEPCPMAYPAFDREHFLERGYCALLFAMRRASIQPSTHRCDNLYRLFGHQFDAQLGLAAPPVHVPAIIAVLPELPYLDLQTDLLRATRSHFEETGIDATVTPNSASCLPSVRVRRASSGASVSVIIPIRRAADLLLPRWPALQAAATIVGA